MLPLRNVDTDIPLAEVIKAEDGLEDVPTVHIESILKGKTNNRILVIMDSYD